MTGIPVSYWKSIFLIHNLKIGFILHENIIPKEYLYSYQEFIDGYKSELYNIRDLASDYW